MTVETVLFDVDGTLVEYERPTGEVLARAFEECGVDPVFTAADYYDRFVDYLEECADADDLRERCFADIAADGGHDPSLGREVAETFAALRDPTRVRTFADAERVLAALGEEYRLGAVTNGPPDFQAPKLEATGLRDAFDAVVFAGYETRAKPHPEPFERALAGLDATPESTVVVGNSLAADVAGAHAAGCASVWLPVDPDVTPDPEPDHACAALADLLDPPWR